MIRNLKEISENPRLAQFQETSGCVGSEVSEIRDTGVPGGRTPETEVTLQSGTHFVLCDVSTDCSRQCDAVLCGTGWERGVGQGAGLRWLWEGAEEETGEGKGCSGVGQGEECCRGGGRAGGWGRGGGGGWGRGGSGAGGWAEVGVGQGAGAEAGGKGGAGKEGVAAGMTFALDLPQKWTVRMECNTMFISCCMIYETPWTEPGAGRGDSTCVCVCVCVCACVHV